ncbi:unnamed protein product [Paramecium octaurelia]|uniref:Uncharacterized protein n=1 Tax=Paramecium octaurelia TaxID=43137 RepID=A0A8S1UG19_PAROT|nr:unnamed protein product [Paramecium octaurelia]
MKFSTLKTTYQYLPILQERQRRSFCQKNYELPFLAPNRRDLRMLYEHQI